MVNTFLPYSDFRKTARVLDYRRLGKQRLEARQIVNALEGKSKGWAKHPAALMWKGYVPLLKLYYNIIVGEWISRGYKNTMELYDVHSEDQTEYPAPWWLGWKPFHYSHRAALIHKDPEFYWDKMRVPMDYLSYGYLWPSHLGEELREKSDFPEEYFDKLNKDLKIIYIERGGVGIPNIPAKIALVRK